MSTEEPKSKQTADKKASASKTPKKIKVEFLKSPTGHFGLGYSEGQTGTLDDKQADILIDAGYAKKV